MLQANGSAYTAETAARSNLLQRGHDKLIDTGFHPWLIGSLPEQPQSFLAHLEPVYRTDDRLLVGAEPPLEGLDADLFERSFVAGEFVAMRQAPQDRARARVQPFGQEEVDEIVFVAISVYVVVVAAAGR